MSIAHSIHEARVKTFCPIEGEVFWRNTRYIGQSPVVRESMIKAFPHAKDIETIIENQKKGQYAYVKFGLSSLPNMARYIPELNNAELRAKILPPSQAPPPKEYGMKTTLLALVDQPHTHMELPPLGSGGVTPHELFEKHCVKRIPAPRFVTIKEADDYDKQVLGRIEEIISGRYQTPISDMPLGGAFVGTPFAQNTVEVRELNPRFAENPMVEQLAIMGSAKLSAKQPSTGFSTVGLTDAQRARLQMEERMVDLHKKWRRYHQTSTGIGEHLWLGNGYFDYYTDELHFLDNDITMQKSIRPALEVTYEFYPYIEDEMAHLEGLQKSLSYMALMGTTDHANFKDKTNNAQVAAFIEHMLKTGLSPMLEVSAIDVVVRYINSRVPAIQQPYDTGRLLFAAKRLEANDVIAKDGFLVVRQNGILTDIIYLLFVKLVFFHATVKSPTGRYAVLSEDLFHPFVSDNSVPACVINTWVGASEGHPHRSRKKFLIFSPLEEPDKKMFEDADTINEAETPLIVQSPRGLLQRLEGMSPIASMLTVLRHECYSNAIQYGTDGLTASTEVLYGTVLAKGVLDVKVFLVLGEYGKGESLPDPNTLGTGT